MYTIFIDDKRICISNRRAYEAFCREFHEVNAAGGLVTAQTQDVGGSGSERCLFIQRNGLWDLPKGHQEAGEDIRTTALREVSEETGIPFRQLSIRPGSPQYEIDVTRDKSWQSIGNCEPQQLDGLICITDHCYKRDGIWHLKHTWWYAMGLTEEVTLTPQTEEGISKALWVRRQDIPALLPHAYSSIAEVVSPKNVVIDILRGQR